MAFPWAQHVWAALPVLIEEPMGDQHIDSSVVFMTENSISRSSPQPSPGARGSAGGPAPFYSQYSSLPSQQLQTNVPRHDQQTPISHYAPRVGQGQPGVGFDMSALGGALPNYGPQSYPQQQQQQQPQIQQQDQRRLSGASAPGIAYQLQQNVQYPQTASSFANTGPYPGFGTMHYASYAHGHISPNPQYPPYAVMQPRQVPGAAQYPLSAQHASPQYYYYPAGYGPPSPLQFPNQPGPIHFGYAGRNSSTGQFGPPGNQDSEGRLSYSNVQALGDDNGKSFFISCTTLLTHSRYSKRIIK